MKSRRERLLVVLLAVLCIYAITLKDSISQAITTLFFDEGATVASVWDDDVKLTLESTTDIMIFVNGNDGGASLSRYGSVSVSPGKKHRLKGVMHNGAKFNGWSTSSGINVENPNALSTYITFDEGTTSGSICMKGTGNSGNSGSSSGLGESEDTSYMHKINLRYDELQGSVKIKKIESYSPAEAAWFMSGDVVGITITPNTEYDLDEIIVLKPESIAWLEDVKGNNGQYSGSFEMPNSDVQIRVTFKEKVKECAHEIDWSAGSSANNGWIVDEDNGANGHYLLCKKCEKKITYKDENDTSSGLKVGIGSHKEGTDGKCIRCYYQMTVINKYSITVSTNVTHAVAGSPTKVAKAGDKVTINTILKNSTEYTFSTWKVNKGNVSTSELLKNTSFSGNTRTTWFIMPNGPVEIEAIYRDKEISTIEPTPTPTPITKPSPTLPAPIVSKDPSTDPLPTSNPTPTPTPTPITKPSPILPAPIVSKDPSTDPLPTSSPTPTPANIECTLNISSNDEEYGFVELETEKTKFYIGDTVIIIASPEEGYEFKTWQVSGASSYITSGPKVTITIGESNVTVTAVFEEVPEPEDEVEETIESEPCIEDKNKWEKDEDGHWNACNVPNCEKSHNYEYHYAYSSFDGSKQDFSNKQYVKECVVCGACNHDWDRNGKCFRCGEEMCKSPGYEKINKDGTVESIPSAYTKDDSGHWIECIHCGKKMVEEKAGEHEWNKDFKCNICGYQGRYTVTIDVGIPFGNINEYKATFYTGYDKFALPGEIYTLGAGATQKIVGYVDFDGWYRDGELLSKDPAYKFVQYDLREVKLTAKWTCKHATKVVGHDEEEHWTECEKCKTHLSDGEFHDINLENGKCGGCEYTAPAIKISDDCSKKIWFPHTAYQGTGDTKIYYYRPGTMVTLVAQGTFNSEHYNLEGTFESWDAGNTELISNDGYIISFIMPDHDVSLTRKYTHVHNLNYTINQNEGSHTGKCIHCDYSITSYHTSSKWLNNQKWDEGHWQECICGERLLWDEHNEVNGYCSECGMKK